MEPDHRDRVFELAAELFGLLSAPVRLRIVSALCKGELQVSELRERVGVSQSNLSQHLTTLYRCGVVSRRREGSRVMYRIDDARAQLLCLAVSEPRWQQASERPDVAQALAEVQSGDGSRPEGVSRGD